MKARDRNKTVNTGPSSVVPSAGRNLPVLRSNEFMLGQKHCNKRDISTIRPLYD